MPLHAQARILCDVMNAAPAFPPSDDTLDQARLGWGLLVMSGAGTPEPVFAVRGSRRRRRAGARLPANA